MSDIRVHAYRAEQTSELEGSKTQTAFSNDLSENFT